MKMTDIKAANIRIKELEAERDELLAGQSYDSATVEFLQRDAQILKEQSNALSAHVEELKAVIIDLSDKTPDWPIRAPQEWSRAQRIINETPETTPVQSLSRIRAEAAAEALHEAWIAVDLRGDDVEGGPLSVISELEDAYRNQAEESE